jgi:hypothetical protein
MTDFGEIKPVDIRYISGQTKSRLNSRLNSQIIWTSRC